MSRLKITWPHLSKARIYSLIISVSVHTLIFSLPISMTAQSRPHQIELFVSLIDSHESHPAADEPDKSKQDHSEQLKKAITPIPTRTPIKKPKKIKPEPIVEKPILNHHPEPEQTVLEDFDERPIVDETESENPPEDDQVFPEIKPPETVVEASVLNQPAEYASAIEIHTPASGTPRISQPIETRFGDSIAPSFLNRVIPVYPAMARRTGKEGRVLLKLTIDAEGNLSDIEIIENAGFGFTEAAVSAVRKSTFLPARMNGKPIISRALLPIKFQLTRNP